MRAQTHEDHINKTIFLAHIGIYFHTCGTGVPQVPFTPEVMSARNMDAMSSATRV